MNVLLVTVVANMNVETQWEVTSVHVTMDICYMKTSMTARKVCQTVPEINVGCIGTLVIPVN